MKGEDQATIESPPNHRRFDPDTAMLNPVLRKCAENANANANARDQQATNAAPVINFSFGREFADLIRGPANALPLANPNAPPPLYTGPPALNQNDYDLNCPTILQANRKAGVDMTLDQFCQQYELDDGIRDRFREHRYKHARMLRFLTVKDLDTMSFMAGEVAEVRDAIDRWSVVVI
jgi:hypothetical protein